MPIYRNVVVDIPPGGYIEKSDQSVFVKDKNEYDPVRKFNVVKHVIIGRAIDPQKMYPNHNFRMRYPEEYKKASGAKELSVTAKLVCHQNSPLNCQILSSKIFLSKRS